MTYKKRKKQLWKAVHAHGWPKRKGTYLFCLVDRAGHSLEIRQYDPAYSSEGDMDNSELIRAYMKISVRPDELESVLPYEPSKPINKIVQD